MKKLTYYFLSALALFFLSLTYMTHQQREKADTLVEETPCDTPIVYETAIQTESELTEQTKNETTTLAEATEQKELNGPFLKDYASTLAELEVKETKSEATPKKEEVAKQREVNGPFLKDYASVLEEPVVEKQESKPKPKPTFVAAKRVPKNPFKEKRYKDSIAVITGKILGKRTSRIKIKKKADELSKWESKSFKVSKDDKTFGGEIVLHESGYYKIYYRSKKYFIYLTPGDSLDITFDPESEEKVVYGGTSAGINTYLAKRDQYDDDNSIARRKMYRLPYDVFKDTIEVERKIKEEFLWSYVKDIESVPAKFVGYELAHIEFEWANQYLDYKELHPKYAPNDFESMDKFSYRFAKKLDLRTDDLLALDSFEDFIERYLDQKADPKINSQVVGSDISGIVISERHRLKYNYVADYFKGKDIRNYLRTKVVLHLIGEDGTPTMNPVLLQFRKDVKNDDYRKLVDDKYSKYAMIDAGSFAKHEQPYFDQLREEYRGRNIEFLSVSIDKSRFAWENMVRNKNMQGHQLFIHGDFDSNFAALYSVKAVPQFILIDPQGQIIDLTARHPSGRVREDLAMLNL